MTKQEYEILEAAGKILTTSGAKGLTIKALAGRTQYSESEITKYFAGEDDIIIALLEYMENNIDERFSKAISPEQTPKEKFTALFRNQFSFSRENPHFVMAIFSEDLMKKDNRVRQNKLRIMAVIMKHIEPIIREGQQMEVFTSVIDTKEVMHVILRIFHLQMIKWQAADFRFDIKKDGDYMIYSILKLIERH